MWISRTHTAFLGVMSIFTGLIGPGGYIGDRSFSYLMTDVKVVAYSTLILLVCAFYLGAKRNWRWFRVATVLIFLGVSILLFSTLLGKVEVEKTGEVLAGLSWGWIFLFIGCLLLMRAYQRRSDETGLEESRFSETIDNIIGIVGAFSLACIVGGIVLSSLLLLSRGSQDPILKKALGGSIMTLSGNISTSSGYTDISYFSYDRKNSRFRSITETEKGKIYTSIDETGKKEEQRISHDTEPFFIGNMLFWKSGSTIFSGSTVIPGALIPTGGSGLIVHDTERYSLISEQGTKTITWTGEIISPLLAKKSASLVWYDGKNGEKYIVRDTGKKDGPYREILSTEISPDGKKIMSLIRDASGTLSLKDDRGLVGLPENYMPKYHLSNGAHSLGIISKNGVKRVVFDQTIIKRDYEEIREMFLEDTGVSYTYFARPLGETKYCIFTRYKGNLCGFDGYMNPTVGADGTSIIYAGLKNGKWGIYRNTDLMIENTGYNNVDIENDYAFYDTTNPRTFLFIKKDTATGKYSYIKNGVTLPGSWDDVGTSVVFGFDNHILTKAKDKNGWKIIEL